jgi:hypothetical protein
MATAITGNKARGTDMTITHIAAFFDDPHAFMAVAGRVRHQGGKDLDAYCPYPIHGMDHALGIKRSFIGRPVLFMLLFGAFCGFMLQYWTMGAWMPSWWPSIINWGWPINLSGKPFNSWPQFVVVTYESGILCGALTNMALALFTSRLGPRLHTQLFRDDLTDDTFALLLPLAANGGSVERISALLKSCGAERIEAIDENATTNSARETAHA